MPELQFKGKEFVYNHHLTVPFRPLEMHPDKGIGAPALDGNLIIHGDNLHALKALLPTYAGKVDCIYIDPPYNTGNEGWCYNDNVNSPMIQEWLRNNPVNQDDGLRHDKWLSMMWPRLRLLRELLSDDGVFIAHIDENEAEHFGLLADEVLCTGGMTRLGEVIWNKMNPKGDARKVSYQHETIMLWGKPPSDKDHIIIAKPKENALAMLRLAKKVWEEDQNTALKHYRVYVKAHPDLTGGERPYNRIDADGRVYRLVHMGWPNKKVAPDEYFVPLRHPITNAKAPVPERGWRYPPDTFTKMMSGKLVTEPDGSVSLGVVNFPKDNQAQPQQKYFLDENLLENVSSVFSSAASDDEFFSSIGLSFDYAKPWEVATQVLGWVQNRNALVLDSFAGSGTTAHAVLAANARDGGNRRFILVEGEDYADVLTAERVRRVISGYKYTGVQRELLYREPITLSKLKNTTAMFETVQRVETLEGPKFSRISKTVKDGALVVTGEREVKRRTPGFGGSFTYCTLGPPVEMDTILSGGALPDTAAMAGLLWHTATAQPFDTAAMTPAPHVGDGVARLGTFAGRTYWLFYRPDLDWLKSGEAALSLTRARAIAETAAGNHLVFAPAKFVSRELLARERLDVDYAPLPFALYRLETA